MSQLKAPNGKPSNLTQEQWKLVRTPQFKAWFGDWENEPENASKVVDENGEPLVVYHSTNKDFNVFENRGYSSGFFFTPYRNDFEFAYRGSKIISAFLNIKILSELSNIPKEKWSVPMFENKYIKESQKDKEYQSQKTWDSTIFKGYPNSDGIKFIDEYGKQIIVAFEPAQIKPIHCA